ncbi:hypothetical protein D7X87_13140 [bacterium D16-54]|nr:hypothetical protein D7X87_13140 [bacterium D16-54]RKJ13865.1 hypothetical protein D7X65_14175 [bacterium D16-56]
MTIQILLNFIHYPTLFFILMKRLSANLSANRKKEKVFKTFSYTITQSSKKGNRRTKEVNIRKRTVTNFLLLMQKL